MHQLMKLAATVLDSGLDKFDKFAESFGVKESNLQNVRPLPENTAYTSFLFRIASTGSPAEGAAAICPCAWSYIEIGRKLARALVKHYDVSETDALFYGSYQTPEYAQLIALIRDMISRGAERASDSERTRIRNNLLLATDFEKMFWDMA